MPVSFGWKRMFLILLATSSVSFAAEAPATAPGSGRPPLLNAAFNAFLEHQGRWAYTETHSGSGSGGKPKAESIVRVDPSQPYAQQRVPIKLSGQPPSEKQLKEWAEHYEQEAKRRLGNAPSATPMVPGEEGFHLQILNQLVVPELEHATVLAEDDTAATYDVPMHKAGDTDARRFDAFQLTVRVNKQLQQFDHATIRQGATVRVAAGKYSDGLTEIEFATPDPHYPPLPVKHFSRTTNKPLFGPGLTMEDVAVRTELRHVTPYDERFGVKIGPIRTIQF
jgi:hypothetical protein